MERTGLSDLFPNLCALKFRIQNVDSPCHPKLLFSEQKSDSFLIGHRVLLILVVVGPSELILHPAPLI